MKGRVSNVVAGCFAIAAFAIALIAGVAGGNPTGGVLTRAMISMIVCYPIGLIIGLICERVVDNHLREHRAQHPVPPRHGDKSASQAETSGLTDEEPMAI